MKIIFLTVILILSAGTFANAAAFNCEFWMAKLSNGKNVDLQNLMEWSWPEDANATVVLPDGRTFESQRLISNMHAASGVDVIPKFVQDAQIDSLKDRMVASRLIAGADTYRRVYLLSYYYRSERYSGPALFDLLKTHTAKNVGGIKVLLVRRSNLIDGPFLLYLPPSFVPGERNWYISKPDFVEKVFRNDTLVLAPRPKDENLEPHIIRSADILGYAIYHPKEPDRNIYW